MSSLWGCNHVFFQPDTREFLTPKYAELAYEDLTIPSKEGFPIWAWWIKAIPPRFGTVVHFHGNAENMSSHFLYAQWLARAGFDVVTFDYRGYGRTPGDPDREGAIRDGRTVMEWVLQHPVLKHGDHFVFAQSLGGALGVAAVANGPQDPWDGLVLDSTFGSYRTIARRKLHNIWLTWALQYPLSFLVTDDLSPVDLAPKIKVPVVMVHGAKDLVVEIEHGRDLFEALPGEKVFWELKNGTHTSAFADREGPWRPKLVGWLCDHGSKKTKKACRDRLAEMRKEPCPYSPAPDCSPRDTTPR